MHRHTIRLDHHDKVVALMVQLYASPDTSHHLARSAMHLPLNKQVCNNPHLHKAKRLPVGAYILDSLLDSSR